MPASEPLIVINGNVLSEGQAMTLRVAIETWAMELSNAKFAKKLGTKLATNYLDRIAEVRRYMGYGDASK